MKSYWGKEYNKETCLYLESVSFADVAMKVSYDTFMNICNDILINSGDKQRFISKRFEKDVVERLLSNIEM